MSVASEFTSATTGAASLPSSLFVDFPDGDLQSLDHALAAFAEAAGQRDRCADDKLRRVRGMAVSWRDRHTEQRRQGNQ